MKKPFNIGFIIIGILIFFIFNKKANSQWHLGPAETFSEAFEFFSFGEYAEALPLFQSLLIEEDNNDHLRYLIGVCYLKIEGQRQRALPYLEKAVNNLSLQHETGCFDEKSAPVESLYFLGLAYRLAYRFEESLGSFGQMIEILEDRYDMRQLEREAEITKNAKMFYSNKEPINIIPREEKPVINHLHRNIVVSGDESSMVYTEVQRFYDAIFFTRKSAEGWSRPVNITMQLGSDGLAYPVSLSFDGDVLYLYQYDLLSNTNLYSSRRENNRWTAMEKLSDNINSAGFDQHASVTKDGSTLYFSSNRPSGKGRFDIYRSRLDENMEWRPAENLGYPINTPFDESYPFISPDGKTLFFSSTGHTGMGSYDIFVSYKSECGSWSVPRNMGYPINTPDDDTFFVPVANGDKAYMNFRKKENNDLKKFQKISSFDVDTASVSILRIKVTTESTDKISEPGTDITIRQINPFDSVINLPPPDPLKYYELELSWGEYEIELSSPGHQSETLSVSIPEYYPEDKYYITAQLGSIDIPSEPVSPVIIEIQPVFFGFDKQSLDDQSLVLIKRMACLLNSHKNIIVELKGYTDALGPDAYNKLLAGRRARAVKYTLLNEGVEKERISITAVGMDNYIARNTTAEGLDNIEGRSYNRRVEFIFSNLPENIILENILNIPEHLKKK